MSEMQDFYKWLRAYGLEYFNKYYALYDAVVQDNKDPDKMGKVKVICPQIDAQNAIDAWFRPALMQSGNGYGWFWPPEVGDRVLICFRQGDLMKPAWYMGAWVAKGQIPTQLGYPDAEDVAPTRRGFVTKTGHAFVINEESGQEAIDLIWKKGDATSSIKMLPNGGLEIKNAQQSQVLIDAENKRVIVEDKDNGNVITLDSSGVKIATKAKVSISGATEFSVDASQVKLGSGAGKSAVYGEDLIQWLNTHTHPTGVGPSGPPTIPANASITSQTVKVK